MKKIHPSLFSSFVCIALMTPIKNSFAADTIEEAIKQGTATIDMRYRYEYADQDGIAETAHASTLRTRLGYKTDYFHNFAAGLEFENVTQIGDDEYNSTVNGKTQHPVVADPETNEINRLFNL